MIRAADKLGRSSLPRNRDEREHWVMADSNPNHTCPYCELVFPYHVEVKDHILRDHPEHASVVDTIDPHELPHA